MSMTRKRLELTDSGDRDPQSAEARLRRLLKNALRIYGFRAGPVVPLADSALTSADLAAKLVVIRQREDGTWVTQLCTESGSIVRFLDAYACREAAECGATWWREVLALVLEWGARLHAQGRIEVKL